MPSCAEQRMLRLEPQGVAAGACCRDSDLLGAALRPSNETNRGLVAKLALPDRYPVLEGIGFSQRISSGMWMPSCGQSISKSNEPTSVPRGNRPEYHSIIFLQPIDGNDRRSIGFDMWTDPMQIHASCYQRRLAAALTRPIPRVARLRS
jgi:two-component system, OmpR family, sensor kinase